jgi:hypothetical protein
VLTQLAAAEFRIARESDLAFLPLRHYEGFAAACLWLLRNTWNLPEGDVAAFAADFMTFLLRATKNAGHLPGVAGSLLRSHGRSPILRERVGLIKPGVAPRMA